MHLFNTIKCLIDVLCVEILLQVLLHNSTKSYLIESCKVNKMLYFTFISMNVVNHSGIIK